MSVERREMRMYCRINVLFRSTYENFSGTCVNLGMHGMYIGFEGGSIEPGENVEDSFLVSGCSSSLVEAWGRVAWVNIGPDRSKPDLPEGFGVEFLEMNRESRDLIRSFLDLCSSRQD